MMKLKHTNFLQLHNALPLSDKFLDLSEFMVTEVENKPNSILVHVKKKHRGEYCPKCDHFTVDHHSYRTKERRVQDLPAYSKPTYLIICTERFDCRYCGERGITETYEAITRGAQKTKRFEQYLHNNNHHNTFQHNARANKISTASIFGKFKQFIRSNLVPCTAMPYVLPKILNMDDVSRKKGHKYMTVIADYAKKNFLMRLKAENLKFYPLTLNNFPKPLSIRLRWWLLICPVRI